MNNGLTEAPMYKDIRKKQADKELFENKNEQRMSAVKDADRYFNPNKALFDYFNPTLPKEGLEPLQYGMTKEDISMLGIPVELQDQISDQELYNLISNYKADQGNKIYAAQRFMGLEDQPTATPTQIDAWRQFSR